MIFRDRQTLHHNIYITTILETITIIIIYNLDSISITISSSTLYPLARNSDIAFAKRSLFLPIFSKRSIAIIKQNFSGYLFVDIGKSDISAKFTTWIM